MAESLPKEVRIREVGPRDGFQNEPEVIPTEEKVRLIGMLADSGLRRIELKAQQAEVPDHQAPTALYCRTPTRHTRKNAK